MFIPVTMHKAEKYAIDRRVMSDGLFAYLKKSFGGCRKVYNYYVDFLYKKLEKLHYQVGDPIPDLTLPEVTAIKKEFPYLSEIDSLGLANEKLDFQDAVKRFNENFDHKTYTKRALRRDRSGTEPLSFRGLKGMPKFHAKARGYFSYTTNCQYPAENNNLRRPTIRLEQDFLHLPKLKEDLRLIIHRPLPEGAVINNVTISMDSDGQLFASIGYTYTVLMDMTLREAALAGDESILDRISILGLDYSQPDFYVDSEGRKANPPHAYVKLEERIAFHQRELSRMQKGSKNYEKKLKQIQRLQKKAKNQRLDYTQKESTYLVSRYDVIVVEDIDLRAMGSALSLGKNLHDNGFGMFRDMLSYKLEQKGSVLVKTDKWFPSTKTCSCCGHVNPEVTLGVKEWTCPECGTHHLRDHNAAVNIREEGRRILLTYLSEWIREDEKARALAAARTNGRKNKNKKETKTA